LNTFGFQKQKGVYLNKSFYFEKLRVSYFENMKRKNSHPNFIFRRFIELLCEVSHAEKCLPVSDWWLH